MARISPMISMVQHGLCAERSPPIVRFSYGLPHFLQIFSGNFFEKTEVTRGIVQILCTISAHSAYTVSTVLETVELQSTRASQLCSLRRLNRCQSYSGAYRLFCSVRLIRSSTILNSYMALSSTKWAVGSVFLVFSLYKNLSLTLRYCSALTGPLLLRTSFAPCKMTSSA